MAASDPLPSRLTDIHNHLRNDPGGDRLIEIMDTFGVGNALIMGLPQSPNEGVLDAMRKHPGRFVGGAYLDPRLGSKAIDALKHYHAEGMKVVKLFPNFGYYPDEDRLRPFFDAVAESQMAVLSHCGWLAPTMGVTAAHYSHPGKFEKLLRAYPETIFIFAHMGGIDGFLETRMLISRAPNAFADISPGQGLWVMEYAGPIAASMPTDKIMWGADMYYDRTLLDRYHEALVARGMGESLEKIFHTNAQRLLQTIGAVGSPN